MNSSNPIAQGRPSRIGSPACGAPSGAARHVAARGFTLIEMLVSLAITLIMMGAVVTLFGVITESVSGARSAIEMADRLRGAKEQLQLDLQGVTATMTPPLRPEMDQGYLEIIEGPLTDAINGIANAVYPDADDHLLLFGDTDDILMFTARNRSAPFLGKANGNVVESPVAEVIYFLAQDPNSQPPIYDATTTPPKRLFTLYRRVLLVAPSVGDTVISNDYYNFYDVSARPFPSPTPTAMRPNTLGDLTKRENRFGHMNNWIFPLWPVGTVPTYGPTFNARVLPLGIDTTPSGIRLGDDILLTNVLSFDVQLWDQGAPVFFDATANVAAEPRDIGWKTKADNWKAAGYPYTSPPAASQPIAFGAFVDLGYGIASGLVPPANVIQPLFQANCVAKSQLTGPPYIFDTWSLHYENDGLTSTGTVIAAGNGDRGTDGLDDPSVGISGIVDDLGEYDTQPPYAAPLRGIKITIRTYEPNSQQVREAVVIQNFDTK